ncbi:hypothetical protein SAMN05446935_8912 [Burkholderia sp. YR290]|jgi:hypothetical protein|nr:hypothetical protein PMI06_001128 [Burkholderia sp. BT03]SKC98760.1 hypothetical protein SAMN05446934_7599 [Paraburkholderia hospita]SKD02960.1 hypothetical protein SAMN05445504_8913 [Burkholderia sp. CF099]SKD07452.1 hypothetical protein SAMN06266956_9937 [Paraburkholderia hospita]SOE89643.1 hypothetical protein SAMN05446935_8912 [Burkholderia sp. YR290]
MSAFGMRKLTFLMPGMKKFHFRRGRIGPIIRASGGFQPGQPPGACTAAQSIGIRR